MTAKGMLPKPLTQSSNPRPLILFPLAPLPPVSHQAPGPLLSQILFSRSLELSGWLDLCPMLAPPMPDRSWP